MRLKFAVLILFGIISLLLAEGLLRYLGRLPGNLYEKTFWFQKVDTLYSLSGYSSDADGIFKMDTSLIAIFDTIKYENPDDYQKLLEADSIIGTYAALVKDFEHLRSGKINCSLYTRLQEIQSKPTLNDFDSAFIKYIYQPINSDGFFSIPFKPYNTSKPKVLLIGDSFTWGHSTSNKALSFANELLAAGCVVYNTGISGTDPAQYEAVAKKYIPILKPDIVIVNFFMGNDISYWDRDVNPYQPVFFPTNAGNLMAFQEGNYFNNPQDAYNNVVKNLHVPTNNWLRILASKTSITSLLWHVWFKLGMTTMPHHKEIPKNSKPSCNEEIAAIQEVCTQYNAQFELIVIPDYKYHITEVESQHYLFEDLAYTYSQVPKSAYNLEDGHFSDEGHKLFSEQLNTLILHHTFSNSDTLNR